MEISVCGVGWWLGRGSLWEGCVGVRVVLVRCRWIGFWEGGEE